jgi:ligand-binding sensor domain-containing protein
LIFFREANNSNGFEALRANLNNGNDQQITNLNCLVEDKRGYVWLGTDRGILVNYTSQQLFNSPSGLYSTVEFRTINYAGHPLLGNENVTAIAVDGADRKWIGTSSSGVFLMSADGREKLRQFNTQNSPLNSNTITALAINPKTGTVYIGTDRGLMSYGGDATQGSRTEQSIMIFPNPVSADFTGEIGIQGLVENAHVRITDVRGALVFEGRANGGMITWNGTTRNGQRVRPGVYLVFATNDDGSVGNVGRIFFNR